MNRNNVLYALAVAILLGLAFAVLPARAGHGDDHSGRPPAGEGKPPKEPKPAKPPKDRGEPGTEVIEPVTQSVSAELTLPKEIGVGGVVEICSGSTCTTESIPLRATRVAIGLDYTLASSEAHLPQADVVGGLPTACRNASGASRPGAVLDVGRGSFESLSGITLTTVDERGATQKREVLRPGAGADVPVDPEPARICLLAVPAT